MKDWIIIGSATIVCALVLVLARSPLAMLEQEVTYLRYQVRGREQADTNIVLVYIDQEAIKSLHWPVRRNFYALMLKALADLRVRAIGIEPLFEDPSLEYPEYDDLLARMVAQAGNVVLTSYWDSVASPGASVPQDDSLPPRLFDYPAVLTVVPPALRVHLPLPSLRASAAGIGHVNIRGQSDVDLFLGSGSLRSPAFGLELLRVFLGLSRSDVICQDGEVALRREGSPRTFRTSGEGNAEINFPGPLRSFIAYPFLEVLRSYDALRAERPGLIPVGRLTGKIVLLGVIAEGRSVFVPTPVDSRLPALALHASFVDNALRDAFIRRTPFWIMLLLALATGLASGGAILFMRSPLNRVVLVGIPLCVIIVSVALFAAGGIEFPIVGPVATAVVAGVAGIILRQRRAKEQLAGLESEKARILQSLHDREAKVAMLEQEIVNRDQERSRERTEDMLEELRRYKAEIRTLSSQADDLDAYDAGESRPSSAQEEFEGMIYDQGGALAPVVAFVSKIAASDAPVLVLGESGTGKELIARAIHRRSPRAQGMFVAVNCGALAESLLESELFGHEKGAFTGAIKEKPGRFELADGGTIFLDEIGEVSEGFQLKLLRVLQEGELERVGGTKTIRVNVRIVAATNRDLKDLVRQKRFREDLYYRLDVFTVALPPLCERQTDIPLLIAHFLEREGGALRVSKNVMDALQNYRWPGNIRELESAIKRGALLAKAEKRPMITVKDLSEDIAAAARGSSPVEEQVLESLRDKLFSRSAVTDTADELGGFNRGTVAEYLRGESLKAFAECSFDLEKAVRRISLSGDPAVNDRVRKKFNDYLANIAEAISPLQTWDVNRAALRPKTKNLPLKYHQYLEQVGEAFFRGIWKR